MAESRMVPQLRFKDFSTAWEKHRLIDVCDYVDYRGKTPEKTDDGIFLVTAKNVKNGYVDYETSKEFISENDYEEVMHRGKPEIGDVLITTEAPCGNVAQVDRTDIALAQRIIKYRGHRDIIDNTYLKQYLLSPKFQSMLSAKSTGGTVQGIKGSVLHQQVILCPKYEEQVEIGECFDDLDNLITLHQRNYNKLHSLKKAMLEKMFPKAGNEVPEIRFSGFNGAWDRCVLSSFAKEISRVDPKSTVPIMMITANDGFIEQSDRYAFNNAGESLKKYIILKKGELAYNHGASKLRPYGSCFALTTVESARIPFVYHCFSVQPNVPEFISLELNGSQIASQLRRIVSSGARMDGLLNISYEEYCNVEVLLPSIPEQQRIADYFRQLDNLITLHHHKTEKLTQLKQSLLEKMFV